jgi:hypothetical protein
LPHCRQSPGVRRRRPEPVLRFRRWPRSEADAAAVEETRSAVRGRLGTRATFVEQEHNRGLANSIIAGTTELCRRHGRAIVVEDDLILAPSFLRFLNEGLDRFRNEPRVLQVSGYMFDVPSLAHNREALLLPMTTSWGWATWKRAWDLFDPAATGWRERLVGVDARRFDLGGRYAYTSMLERQMTKGIDSWAIRWYYSVFVHDGLVLFPPRTLAYNAGLDGSGTHGRFRRLTEQRPAMADDGWTMPGETAVSSSLDAVLEAVGSSNRLSLWRAARALLTPKRAGR